MDPQFQTLVDFLPTLQLVRNKAALTWFQRICCRDRRAELDEAQLNLAALKALSDEADLLRSRVAELEPLQVTNMESNHWL